MHAHVHVVDAHMYIYTSCDKIHIHIIAMYMYMYMGIVAAKRDVTHVFFFKSKSTVYLRPLQLQVCPSCSYNGLNVLLCDMYITTLQLHVSTLMLLPGKL